MSSCSGPNGEARRSAKEFGGKVVRVVSYSPEETAARRAVIEAAKAWCRDPLDLTDCERVLVEAVDALEALERKEAKK